MRLWHYKFIPYLPNSQLLAQWRELNSIYKKQDNHILINYVYEYPDQDLFIYSILVIREMQKRNFKITSFCNFCNYFNFSDDANFMAILIARPPFERHHNDRYLLQCFYNLEEKYDRGQKDFSEEQYVNLCKLTFRRTI